MSLLSKRLQGISNDINLAGMADITRGIEKESLRVCAKGTLAKTAHPKALGSALTHPRITTDYSEALLEFITPPSDSIDELVSTLSNLHRFTYQHIDNESLWVNSMPCMLGNDGDIPIAQYGTSNSGKMKSIYRLGLGHRYGRSMQTIAGIHFNFSVSDKLWTFLHQEDKSELSLTDYKTEGYFRLIRNFRRYFWLLLYLFGAAPAVCSSFVKGRDHQLKPLGSDSHSLHLPFATSLRMGDLGYQSSAQESLVITYNCLNSYIKTLCKAITQTHPQYKAIGITDNDGNYQQLNDSLLQIENEFYSVIRPKRTARSGQTALNALSSGGVEYIEVRCLDLNPFEPVGINAQQIRFLDLFLLYCLLEDSPLSDEKEYRDLQENQKRTVYEGRDPDLMLYHFGNERSAREWGNEIINKLQPIAELMDKDAAASEYQEALANEALKLKDSNLTPSAKVLEEMRNQSLTFYKLAEKASMENRQYFVSKPLSNEELSYYEAMAKESLLMQQQIEADTSMSFDDYLKNYYEGYDYCSKNKSTLSTVAD